MTRGWAKPASVQYVGVVEKRAPEGDGREEEPGHRELAADLPAPPCDHLPRSPCPFGAANEYEQAKTREQKAHRDRVALEREDASEVRSPARHVGIDEIRVAPDLPQAVVESER